MKKLSEKQQRLLSAYYDHELGFFSNLYVEKILLQTSSAQTFLSELVGLSTHLNEATQLKKDSLHMIPANKWNALNSRLLQVEKNSIFHDPEFLDNLNQLSFWKKYPIPVTVAAASTAFCLGLIFKFGYLNFINTNDSLNNRVVNNQQNIATNLSSGNVSSGNSSVGAETKTSPKPIVSSNIPLTFASNPGSPSAVELDWLKSDGRIRMIPARNGSSNIIWVKAPRSIYLAQAQQNTQQQNTELNK